MLGGVIASSVICASSPKMPPVWIGRPPIRRQSCPIWPDCDSRRSKRRLRAQGQRVPGSTTFKCRQRRRGTSKVSDSGFSLPWKLPTALLAADLVSADDVLGQVQSSSASPLLQLSLLGIAYIKNLCIVFTHGSQIFCSSTTFCIANTKWFVVS